MNIINVVCSNLIEQNGKFLFVLETKEIARGRYNLPAGRLEPDESIIDGAIREAQEETGLLVEPIKLIGIYQRVNSSEGSNTTNFCFLSKIISGEITPTPEHPEIVWLSLDEIKVLGADHKLRSRYIIPAINDYFSQKGTDISFLTVIK